MNYCWLLFRSYVEMHFRLLRKSFLDDRSLPLSPYPQLSNQFWKNRKKIVKQPIHRSFSTKIGQMIKRLRVHKFIAKWCPCQCHLFVFFPSLTVKKLQYSLRKTRLSNSHRPARKWWQPWNISQPKPANGCLPLNTSVDENEKKMGKEKERERKQKKKIFDVILTNLWVCLILFYNQFPGKFCAFSNTQIRHSLVSRSLRFEPCRRLKIKKKTVFSQTSASCRSVSKSPEKQNWNRNKHKTVCQLFSHKQRRSTNE